MVNTWKKRVTESFNSFTIKNLISYFATQNCLNIQLTHILTFLCMLM